jgi:transcriptional regulator with PAS, ATPase and Fis domain
MIVKSSTSIVRQPVVDAKRDPFAHQHLIGGPTFSEVLRQAQQSASTSAAVLITGETGVGKELVASYIHSCSPRAGRPFVAVNCAGLPETLLESELFGHVKGSFTGAYRDKPGKFEMAHTGTLFLDEVGEMTIRMQGLLLRVLENGEIQKVGADQWTGRVDCRVVAATNRDLQEMAARGEFRHDLYYRLNVMRVHVPALRDRPDEILPLTEYFIARHSNPALPRRFAPEVRAAFEAFGWPGNVRQLENVVQRMVINSPHDTIGLADLPAEVARETQTLPVRPLRERRRSTADVLHEHLTRGASFWTVVYEPFMKRDLTRADLKALVELGLRKSGGNYRVLTRLFNMSASDYKRFLHFLRKHECLLPFRNYR